MGQCIPVHSCEALHCIPVHSCEAWVAQLIPRGPGISGLQFEVATEDDDFGDEDDNDQMAEMTVIR